ncbi:MAG: cytochrome C oxidase subunit I [Gammaproteobacteria bacterium]|nr:cytochrome C oxidase subunit I [Gammaproteobacteria bacterium]
MTITTTAAEENDHEFISPIPSGSRRTLAVAWLWLGLMALLGSGLFSVMLVLSRTPYLQNIFPWVDFFHTALVIHVDLSVLVWFLAFAGLLWSLNSTARFMRLGWGAFILAAAGTAVMALSPFIGADHPLMSNYIPVLDHPLFLAGLLGFAAGFALLVGRSMIAIPAVGQRMTAKSALRFGLNTVSVSAVMVLMAFIWSYVALPGGITGKAYFELLFWGGGHMLQFTYTLLTLIAWLWLASVSGIRLPLSPRVVVLLFFLGLVTVFMAPLIYYAFPVASAEHIKLFTWLMAYGGSLATLPLGLALLYAWFRSPPAAKEYACHRSALMTSMLLFGFGGVIGFLIEGSNVTIPAHYHGSIVGVTLALMGLTYDLLPRLGYSAPHLKWSRIQPYVYGGGQLLHVVGLVWSGGYGVQRKVAGVEQGLDGLEKITAMGLMGLGGLIAILGGLLFLIIVLSAMKSGRRDT